MASSTYNLHSPVDRYDQKKTMSAIASQPVVLYCSKTGIAARVRWRS